MNPQHEYPIKRTHFTFDIETGSRSFDEVETYCPKIKPHKGIKDADKTALSPLTGQVLVIGLRVEGVNTLFHVDKEGDEKSVLEAFFSEVRKYSDQKWIGHNCHAFDWPYLRGRAMALNVPFPTGIVSSICGQRYLNYAANCRDTMLAWNPDPTSRISVNNLGKILGLGTKTGHGKHFDKLYAESPDEALAYCERDLELTDAIWQRIGI